MSVLLHILHLRHTVCSTSAETQVISKWHCGLQICRCDRQGFMMFSYIGAAYSFLFAFLSGICCVQVSLCAADAEDGSNLCYEVL